MPLKILITAGPTREMLDPVRYLSNLSTGEMGYRIAQVARTHKHTVTLISGPTALKAPRGVRFVPVVSARDLLLACRRFFPRCDVLIMSAAVCDFTAANIQIHKIRRVRNIRINLQKTPDILAEMAAKKTVKQKVVGFCLETEDWITGAKRKVKGKHLDGIVANYCSKNYKPFGNRRVTVALVDSALNVRILKQRSKTQVADSILRWVETAK